MYIPHGDIGIWSILTVHGTPLHKPALCFRYRTGLGYSVWCCTFLVNEGCLDVHFCQSLMLSPRVLSLLMLSPQVLSPLMLSPQVLSLLMLSLQVLSVCLYVLFACVRMCVRKSSMLLNIWHVSHTCVLTDKHDTLTCHHKHTYTHSHTHTALTHMGIVWTHAHALSTIMHVTYYINTIWFSWHSPWTSALANHNAKLHPSYILNGYTNGWG